MVASLRRNDRVVTAGGIIGKVTRAPEDGEVEVEIAENVRVKVIRETITQVVKKSAPEGSTPPPPANQDSKPGGMLGGIFKR